MVYGTKEVLADSLVMVAEDIGVPCAIPLVQILVQKLTERDLTDLVSRLGACNREESALPLFNAGKNDKFPTSLDHLEGTRRKEIKRKELQKAIFFPLIEPALEIHRKRLVSQEQRDVSCHYLSPLRDPKDEQSHDIRLLKHAGGTVYKRSPWNRRSGQSAYYALCPLSVLHILENKLGDSQSQLFLLKHSLDPAPHVTLAKIGGSAVVSPSFEYPEKGLWHDYESRQHGVAHNDHQLQDGALAKKLNDIRAETYVTALGGAIPHDMFPADNFAHLAPREHKQSRPSGPIAQTTLAGKMFELPDDASPPESLMIQREEDDD